MNELVLYLLKSGLSLIMLYAVYWFFLSRDTFFKMNRAYLIISVFFSLLFPLLPISLPFVYEEETYVVMLDTIVINSDSIHSTLSSHLTTFQIISIIYLTGASIFLVRFLFQVGQLLLMVRHYGISHHEGLNIVFIDRNYSPFSFFGLIFINRKKLSGDTIQEILDHEQIHIRQGHSLDLILFELMTIVQWFNPFVWFYRNSLKSVHEYLADEGVLLKGYNAINYQTLLLSLSTGIQVNDLTNNFNHSLIKKRITMMTKSKSSFFARLKLLLVMPVAFLLVVAFTASPMLKTMAQSNAAFPKSDTTLPSGVKYTVVKDRKSGYFNNKPIKGDIYAISEITPEFPGGEEARVKYLASKIKYPDQARKEGKEGTVYIQFIVEKDGKISNGKVLRGFDEGCDKVALDAIMSMPNWEPGLEKGQAIRFQFNMPVKFSLGNEGENEKGTGGDKAPPPPPKKDK